MCLIEPPGLLVALSMMRAESRCCLIRLTTPAEKVISLLVWLQPQADYWMMSEGVLLTLALWLWLSVTLVMLQEEGKLSAPPQGLPILLLQQ